MVDRHLQDREAATRSRVHPVVNQIIECVNGQLRVCPDYTGPVREQLQPVVTSIIRFLARCLDAQEGGQRSPTRYLFDTNALEDDLQQHLIDWLYATDLYGYTIESQHVGGGRIDLMFTFEGFRFVVELKREKQDASRTGLAAYLQQAGAYQVTGIAVGMLVVLDLTAEPLAPHMRDNVWVDVLPPTDPGGTERHVCVVRVPGNRRSPSRLP